MSTRPSNGAGWTEQDVRRLHRLSDRDRDWLVRLSQGARVCELDGRSHQGVKNRLAGIREFLKVKTTIQAVAEAIRRGIIE